jgi:hypothetical protein
MFVVSRQDCQYTELSEINRTRQNGVYWRGVLWRRVVRLRNLDIFAGSVTPETGKGTCKQRVLLVLPEPKCMCLPRKGTTSPYRVDKSAFSKIRAPYATV